MLSQHFIKQVLVQLEKLLNAYLSLDPDLPTSLAKMAGTVVALEGKRFCCYCCVTATGIQLQADPPPTVDVRLQASWFDYARLAMKPTAGATDMRIQGNLESARQFQALFANLSIDWEAQLAKIVGDPTASIAMQLLSNLVRWGKTTRTQLSLNLTEYLQAEIRVLPVRLELQDFFTAVDHLRDDVDRLQAHLMQLSGQLQLPKDRAGHRD